MVEIESTPSISTKNGKILVKKIRPENGRKRKKIFFFDFLVFIGGKWGQERVGMKSILTCQTIEIGLKNGMSKDLYLSERGQVDAAKTFSAKRKFFLAGNFLAKFSHFWGFSRAQISNLKSEKTFIENFFDFWPKNRNFWPKIELFGRKSKISTKNENIMKSFFWLNTKN